MADLKISALTGASTPLAGTEVLPIVQSSTTKKVSIANLTAGRNVAGLAYTGFSPDGTKQLVFTPGDAGHQILGDYSTGSNVPIQIGIYSIPAMLKFETTGDVTVKNNLVIGTSGKGIDFSATSGTGTSELLADYEEGTFTAVITMGSGTATVSSANDLMSYTKVGRLVTINGQFQISAVSSPSGTMKITLPFTVANGSEGAAFSVGGAMRIFNQVLPVGLYPIIQANNNDNTATFFMVTSAGTLTNMLPIADGFFMISLTYIV